MRPTGIGDVLVVGGGDIGLLTALSLRKLNPGIDVSVVDDFEADPPEVGKSTYQKIVPILHSFLEIPEERFLSEAKPLWKATVYFRDWCGCDPFHYPFDDPVKYPGEDSPTAVEQYYLHYTELYADPDHRTVNEAMVEQGKSPLYGDPRGGGYSSYENRAYHLDLTRFNAFLRTVCEERDVALVDDEITAVATDGHRIEGVRGEDGAYEADLYVDATGFNRVLKGELDDEFREFDLPLDAAFNAKLERPLGEAVPATVIDSGEHGWFWQIDTYDFRDVGYVFASEYVDDEDAAAEFIDHCDGAVARDELRRYGFDSGYYRTPWQGNCVAIGNAVGFVEPLQSTGLTANAQSARRLANLLAAQGRIESGGAREQYNAWTGRLWESIYDFICVHYRHASGDSEFWRAVQSIPVSERLQRVIDHFDRSGYDTKINPTETPAPGGETPVGLLVFPPISFYTVMRNMGAESRFYENHPVEVSDGVRAGLEEFYESVDQKVERLLTIEEAHEGVLQWN